MKDIRPGDPVYALREGCGLGLAFRGIVLGVTSIPDEKGEFNSKALVLDTSVPGRPQITSAIKCHPDAGTTREEAQQILARHGYDRYEEKTTTGKGVCCPP